MLLGGRSARLASLGKTESLHSGLLFPRLVIVHVGEPASPYEHLGICRSDREVGADPQQVAPLPEDPTVDDLVGEISTLAERSVGVVVVVRETGDDRPPDRADVLPVLCGRR